MVKFVIALCRIFHVFLISQLTGVVVADGLHPLTNHNPHCNILDMKETSEMSFKF